MREGREYRLIESETRVGPGLTEVRYSNGDVCYRGSVSGYGTKRLFDTRAEAEEFRKGFASTQTVGPGWRSKPRVDAAVLRYLFEKERINRGGYLSVPEFARNLQSSVRPIQDALRVGPRSDGCQRRVGFDFVDFAVLKIMGPNAWHDDEYLKSIIDKAIPLEEDDAVEV